MKRLFYLPIDLIGDMLYDSSNDIMTGSSYLRSWAGARRHVWINYALLRAAGAWLAVYSSLRPRSRSTNIAAASAMQMRQRENCAPAFSRLKLK